MKRLFVIPVVLITLAPAPVHAELEGISIPYNYSGSGTKTKGDVPEPGPTKNLYGNTHAMPHDYVMGSATPNDRWSYTRTRHVFKRGARVTPDPRIGRYDE